MARGRKKAAAKRARGGGSNWEAEIEEKEQAVEVEMDEEHMGKPMTKKKDWKADMPYRKFKNECQVDITSLDHKCHGIPSIKNEV